MTTTVGSTFRRWCRVWAALMASMLGVAFIGFVVSTPPASASSKPPIVLGAVLPLTGASQPSAGPAELGMETAVANINKAGGVLGRKLVLDTLDDTSSATVAAVATQQLLSSDHPVMATMDPVAAQQIATLPFFTAASIPTLTTVATATSTPGMIQQDPYNYEYSPNEPALAAAYLLYGAKYLAGTSPLKLAILYDTETTQINRVAVIQQAISAVGGSIAAIQQIPAGATDATTAISLLKASGANVLCIATNLATSLTVFNAVNALQWNVKVMASGVDDNAQVLNPGALPSFVTNELNVDTARQTIQSKSGGVESQFRTQIHDIVKDTGPIQGLLIETNGYEMGEIMAAAIEKAGSTSSSKIIKVLNNHFVVPAAGDFNGQPNWTASVHTMQNANISDNYGFVKSGTPYLGAFPGVYFPMPKKIPSAFF